MGLELWNTLDFHGLCIKNLYCPRISAQRTYIKYMRPKHLLYKLVSDLYGRPRPKVGLANVLTRAQEVKKNKFLYDSRRGLVPQVM